MAREKEDYRIILERLDKHFRKGWVYPTEIGDYLGINYRTVMRKFDIDRNGCSIETLARKMCI